MPFMTVPKGTPAPSVADMAGMPMEAVGGPMGGLLKAGMGEAEKYAPQALEHLTGGVNSMLRGLQDSWTGVSDAFASKMNPELYGTVTRQPKPGGVLHDVLSRAAENQAVGQDVTPGSKRLLDHYSGLIR